MYSPLVQYMLIKKRDWLKTRYPSKGSRSSEKFVRFETHGSTSRCLNPNESVQKFSFLNTDNTETYTRKYIWNTVKQIIKHKRNNSKLWIICECGKGLWPKISALHSPQWYFLTWLPLHPSDPICLTCISAISLTCLDLLSLQMQFVRIVLICALHKVALLSFLFICM